MNFENKENLQPEPPEKKKYELDRGGEYRVFEKNCERCGGKFSIHVPNRDSESEFIAENGRKISIRELEEQAEAQTLCPECERERAKQENHIEQ